MDYDKEEKLSDDQGNAELRRLAVELRTFAEDTNQARLAEVLRGCANIMIILASDFKRQPDKDQQH